MAELVDASTVKAWLSDGLEIAFIDVREAGQYGEGHPFLAISAPYSVLERMLPKLVPNPHVRLVLLDGADGVAARAARRAESLGYTRVHILQGGAQGWQRAGFTLFRGVNVPSKAFGELVELQRHTPRLSPADLRRRTTSGERCVIVDGRPFAEFERMNIPGGICCPNVELALRIDDLLPDAATPIVVNCAGRTRSIIGAQTLIDLGIANPVFALENGTQGWFLEGYELERGAKRRYRQALPSATRLAELAARARSVAERRGVGFVTAREVEQWLRQSDRTTFLLDVRSLEEHAADAPAGWANAPGGQLIQATDQWVGVKGARLVLLDDDGVRAPMTAQWLSQLGHDAYVLDGGLVAASARRVAAPYRPSQIAGMRATELSAALGKVHIVDLRPSAAYRQRHIEGAIWSIRPRLEMDLPADPARTIVLIDDGGGNAVLAARDAHDAGYSNVRVLDDEVDAWIAAGLPLVSTPDFPVDSARIDYLFFVHDRHDGNAEAARRYLAWEIGLLAQLDQQERGIFRVATE